MIRIVPVLLLKNGSLVRSTGFRRHRVIGDPFLQCARFNSWLIDELIYLDISDHTTSWRGRIDTGNRRLGDPSEIQRVVAQDCLVPLSWGGRLRSYDDASAAIDRGADKVIFTTALATAQDEIARVATRFGEQAVCVGIDYAMRDGVPTVMIEDGSLALTEGVVEWARRAVDSGAGEILLHAIDRDGRGSGYDLSLVPAVQSVSRVPIVLLGGARTPEHLFDGAVSGASAVAAANMWHFSDNVDAQVRNHLASKGVDVRRV
ncbi:MAG TPA: imidazole glycerol phosphate synthase subunit HisF [Actinobacteria bacterium]|nr:imidazole glycerol phosphate synthase subunit HisF [Actinomycetota bacterium]